MKTLALIFVFLLSFLLARSNAGFHFVLIHGAGEGAWSWFKVTQRLQAAGHQVDAPDLASAGRDRTDVQEVKTLEQYSAPLIQILESLPANEKVVLVGSSLAGLSLTLVLEMYPEKIAAAVYLSALMLPSGPIAATLFKQIFQTFGNNVIVENANGSSTPVSVRYNFATVQNFLYNTSPTKDVVLAKTLLKSFPFLDPTVNFTKARYGRVPRYFIKATFDHALQPADQEDLIQRTPPKLVLELPSDHSPFFSQPTLLVTNLVNIATLQLLL
ncbi:putative methylesterase 13, chloroplastic [Selaginella moellendorffii]|uniref:putative methylesterase 13, chloroplastic n=1 Tax=Selaginella moellendorffii TaxID=88036 RepID=UPI000D1CEE09|nr:putative methylesterase 13, chloroplastic [Selaginella moellendorffii]|eukprot:XP_024534507.1 putative methylesterase 13, chloroplastic [Selaginella moellendorffii]